MEEHNKKDLIDHIVDKLKASDELPYKEGAWERFQQKHGSMPVRKNRSYYWAASAAAILLVGAFAVKQFVSQDPKNLDDVTIAQHQGANGQNSSEGVNAELQSQEGSEMEGQFQQEGLLPSDGRISTNGIGSTTGGASVTGGISTGGSGLRISGRNGAVASYQGNLLNLQEADRSNNMLAYSDWNNGIRYAPKNIHAPQQLSGSSLDLRTKNLQLAADEPQIKTTSDLGSAVILANQDMANKANAGREPDLKSKKFNFNERFDLGLFVSPNSTSEKFNFGGGVLVAYNVTKNLSVRTGLAYNRYEVGAMRNPVANQDVAVSASREMFEKNNSNSLTAYTMSNAVILPNVNAVSGSVQALEVPLDVKYKSKSGFYASSGLTYAKVTEQERFTHYIENSGAEVFPDGLPKNQKDLEAGFKQVSKAIKTEDQNVKANGFGGFVNLSIGKEMKMNKGFSISVEPYMKLPVGNFKSADMNYTNGGLRIITNF